MATVLSFFAAAVVLGTLVEYLTHRFFLHSRFRLGVVHRHRMHHKTYVRYSVVSEFFGFSPPAVPLLWVGFVHSSAAGFAFVAGAAAYVLAVAVAHKWSHEAPHRLFWMDPAVHALHHDGRARSNFGVLTTFWDRALGTYRKSPARPADVRGAPGAGG
jgi:sterol desaturase/sphingolipid hydroxylase (fatty acid hydroxylase superfamily)